MTALLRTSIPVTGSLPYGAAPNVHNIVLSYAHGRLPPGREPKPTTPWRLQQARFASTDESPYAILRVSPRASPAEIKKAFYREAKLRHPDISGRNATADYIKLQDAYKKCHAAAEAAVRRAAESKRATEARRAADWRASEKARQKQAADREARKAAEAERKRAVDALKAAAKKKAAEEERAARAQRAAEAEKAAEERRLAEALKRAEQERAAAALQAAEDARRKEQAARLVVLRGVPRGATLFDLFWPLIKWRPGPVLDARLAEGTARVEFYTAEAAHRLFLLATETDKCVILGKTIKAAAKYTGEHTPPSGGELTSRVLRTDHGLTASLKKKFPADRLLRFFRDQGFHPKIAAIYAPLKDTRVEVHFGSLQDARQAKELLEQHHPDLAVKYLTDPTSEKARLDLRSILVLATLERMGLEDTPENRKMVWRHFTVMACIVFLGVLIASAAVMVGVWAIATRKKGAQK